MALGAARGQDAEQELRDVRCADREAVHEATLKRNKQLEQTALDLQRRVRILAAAHPGTVVPYEDHVALQVQIELRDMLIASLKHDVARLASDNELLEGGMSDLREPIEDYLRHVNGGDDVLEW
ncbi:hypothetical protein M885DRAFT_559578 [Pelagophyceae sp. CCMP2097]|nr:hypothetical protein M885DRAFT_559578 [Pelagophyceae sp. CCMP2097]